MPSDRRIRSSRPNPDSDLLRQLESFGQTLATEVDEPITPSLVKVSAAGHPPTGPSHLRVVLVAAAVMTLVVAAATIAWIGTRSTTSTEPADGEIIGTDSTDGTVDRGESTDGQDFDSTIHDAQLFTPEGPTIVQARDGTEIARYEMGPTGPRRILISVSPPGFADHARYVDRVLDDLLVDRGLLAELGWQTGMVDDIGLSKQEWLARSGLVIHTNLDLALTEAAHHAMVEHVPVDSGYETETVTIEPATGRVLVYTTTAPYPSFRVAMPDDRSSGEGEPQTPAELGDESAFRLWFPRTPGSAFAPVVLAEAFEQGYLPDDLVRADGPCEFKLDEGPYTVGGVGLAPQTLAAVTRSSNNCAYARLGQIVGTNNVAELATDLGLASLDPEAGSWPSLPLGVSEVAIEELTAAYATLAADGLRVTPRFVDRIVSPDGTMVIPPEPSRRRVLQPETARLLSEVLITVVESGTGVRARIDGHTVAGKTGTTSNFGDAWFVGYTPALATSVWIGDVDESRAIRLPGWGSVLGGEAPAEVWRLYMTEALADLEPEAFDPPQPSDGEPRLLEVDPVVEAPLD